MWSLLSRHEPRLYALMRMVAGFLFFWHGSQKLLNIPPSAHGAPPPWILFIAGPIEFFCGLLILIGLATRPAAFLASGQMAFAYWYAHGRSALLPVQNQGELAALYCFLFLAIAARGAGPWSLDEWIRSWRKRRS